MSTGCRQLLTTQRRLSLELLAYMLTIQQPYDTNNAAAAGNKAWSRLNTDLYTSFFYGAGQASSGLLGLRQPGAHLARMPAVLKGRHQEGTEKEDGPSSVGGRVQNSTPKGHARLGSDGMPVANAAANMQQQYAQRSRLLTNSPLLPLYKYSPSWLGLSRHQFLSICHTYSPPNPTPPPYVTFTLLSASTASSCI